MNTKLLISAAFVLLAGGCTVGPNYQRPNVKLPAQWGEPLAGGVTNHDDLVGAWWKNLHDPELDSLIGRAVTTNLDLRIAEARVRQARAQQGFAEAGYWPTVNASGAYARQKQSENQPIIGSIPRAPASRSKTVSIRPDSMPLGDRLVWRQTPHGPPPPLPRWPPWNMDAATCW